MNSKYATISWTCLSILGGVPKGITITVRIIKQDKQSWTQIWKEITQVPPPNTYTTRRYIPTSRFEDATMVWRWLDLLNLVLRYGPSCNGPERGWAFKKHMVMTWYPKCFGYYGSSCYRVTSSVLSSLCSHPPALGHAWDMKRSLPEAVQPPEL